MKDLLDAFYDGIPLIFINFPLSNVLSLNQSWYGIHTKWCLVLEQDENYSWIKNLPLIKFFKVSIRSIVYSDILFSLILKEYYQGETLFQWKVQMIIYIPSHQTDKSNIHYIEWICLISWCWFTKCLSFYLDFYPLKNFCELSEV